MVAWWMRRSGGGLRLWLGGPDGPARTPRLIRPATVGFDGVGPHAEFGFAVDAGRVDGDQHADIVVSLPGFRSGDGGVALIRGGPDGYAEGGHALDERPNGEGHRFGTAVALLHLAGGREAPDLVVVAEDAGFDGVVQVIREGGSRRGSAVSLTLRTAIRARPGSASRPALELSPRPAWLRLSFRVPRDATGRGLPHDRPRQMIGELRTGTNSGTDVRASGRC
jgi:hypothetical protein